MAGKSCKCLLLFFFLLLLLFSLSICCSAAVMGFSYDARSKTAISSILKALSTLRQDKVLPSQFQVLVSDHGVLDSLSNTGVPSVIYLKQTQFGYMRSYKALYLRSDITRLGITNVVVSSSSVSDCSKENELQMLLPTLRSTWSLLKYLQLEKPVKVSVALPLSLLNSLNMKQRRHVDQILHFMRETESFLIVEDSVNGEWNMANGFVQSITSKARLIDSLLSHIDVPIILSIRSSVLPSATELSALSSKILRSLDNHPKITILVEVSPVDTLQRPLSSRRELLASSNDERIIHDLLSPPTTSLPTTPVTNPVTTPSTFPPYSPTPTNVTIPATNPVSATPTDPVSSTTPVSATPIAPATNPGAQPVTNPVTTYPSPSSVGDVPLTGPSTTPVTSPSVANAPIVPGQTWCIARSGVPETTLQAALDYACGIGGAECSMIQEGASCYNPDSLENHASYAFNSYFQKNPVASSCDFGGTAVLVNTNPSSGSCTYPSSATTAAPSTIPPATTAAPSTIPPATTASTSGSTGTGSSYGSPPSVLNTSSDPTSGSSTAYGSESPSIITAPPSGSAGLQPVFWSTTLIAPLAMAILVGV